MCVCVSLRLGIIFSEWSFCAINFLSPESINAVNVFFLLSVGLCLLMSKPFCSSWRIKNTIFMFMFMFFFFWLRLHNLMYVCDGMGLLLFSLFVYLLQDSMKYSKSSENWSGDLKSLSLSLSFSLNPHLSRSLSPSDQIPVELPRRRILISHIS